MMRTLAEFFGLVDDDHPALETKIRFDQRLMEGNVGINLAGAVPWRRQTRDVMVLRELAQAIREVADDSDIAEFSSYALRPSSCLIRHPSCNQHPRLRRRRNRNTEQSTSLLDAGHEGEQLVSVHRILAEEDSQPTQSYTGDSLNLQSFSKEPEQSSMDASVENGVSKETGADFVFPSTSRDTGPTQLTFWGAGGEFLEGKKKREDLDGDGSTGKPPEAEKIEGISGGRRAETVRCICMGEGEIVLSDIPTRGAEHDLVVTSLSPPPVSTDASNNRKWTENETDDKPTGDSKPKRAPLTSDGKRDKSNNFNNSARVLMNTGQGEDEEKEEGDWADRAGRARPVRIPMSEDINNSANTTQEQKRNSPPPAKTTQEQKRNSPPPAKTTQEQKRNSPPAAKTAQGQKRNSPPSAKTAQGQKKNAENIKLEFVPQATFLTGPEAYAHYQAIRQVERKVRIRELMEAKDEILQRYRQKKKMIDKIVNIAKDYYTKPTGVNRERWKELRREISQTSTYSKTDLRFRLAEIKEHLPIFTITAMAIQIFVLIVVASAMTFVFPVSGKPVLEVSKVPIMTWHGFETVHRFIKGNPWFGISARDMIGVGFVYAPCMRESYDINLEQKRQNYTNNEGLLGCCELASRNKAGTTTKEECEKFSDHIGLWHNTKCASRLPGYNSVSHNLRPCCLDYNGTCMLTSHDYCFFMQGRYFSTDKEHCSQVLCMAHVCKVGLLEITSAKGMPWQADHPNQFWRVFPSLVHTYGFIHCVLLLLLEWLLMRQLEISAGWLRLALIYTFCGVLGSLMGATMQPSMPQEGTTAAVTGMLGVGLVELAQAWPLVSQPRLELAKLLGTLGLALWLGTLPYVNNFAIICGVMVGVLMSIMILPYITFGSSYVFRRRLFLVVLSATLLVILSIVIFVMFYAIQDFKSCQACKAFDCANYVTDMCNEDHWHL